MKFDQCDPAAHDRNARFAGRQGLQPSRVAEVLQILALLALFSGPALGQAPRPPGRLVDLGGYKLHVNCIGSGKPSVVLFSGAGDYSFDWSLIQTPLSKETRVCSFDRAGYAWSSLGPVPRTMHQEAAEVRQALSMLSTKPPYVLVGHSLGGLVIREYAYHFPADVAGLVFIDPTHEDVKLMYQGKVIRVRDSARGATVPPPRKFVESPPPPVSAQERKDFADLQAFLGPPKINPPYDRLPQSAQRLRLWALSVLQPIPGEDFWADELAAIGRRRSFDELHGLPMAIVLPRTRIDSATSVAEREAGEEKTRQKEGLLSLSTRSELFRASTFGHHVQLEDPKTVLYAIRRVLRR